MYMLVILRSLNLCNKIGLINQSASKPYTLNLLTLGVVLNELQMGSFSTTFHWQPGTAYIWWGGSELLLSSIGFVHADRQYKEGGLKILCFSFSSHQLAAFQHHVYSDQWKLWVPGRGARGNDIRRNCCKRAWVFCIGDHCIASGSYRIQVLTLSTWSSSEHFWVQSAIKRHSPSVLSVLSISNKTWHAQTLLHLNWNVKVAFVFSGRTSIHLLFHFSTSVTLHKPILSRMV